MTDVDEVLKEARKLVRRPGGWTQGQLIKKRHFGPNAYCAVGAIDAVVMKHNGTLSLYSAAMARLRKAINHQAVDSWNDSPIRTKKDVVKAFDKAIQIGNS